jgi:glycosyltransferase involved in cell wall biosynthesis
MRSLYRLSDTSIVTIPREAAPWLPDTMKAVTIPVGSNVAPAGHRPTQTAPRARPPLVAVFGVTGGTSRDNEVRLIAETVAMVREAVPDITLVFFGCGTSEAAPLIQERVACRFEVKGLLPSDEAHRLLESASAVLFVRGAVASGRTTAVSGIVAGTPVVGFLGPTTGPPITVAGAWLVQRDAPEALADALRTVLTDDAVWAEMRQRNVRATAEHFSWTAIAERMARALGL